MKKRQLYIIICLCLLGEICYAQQHPKRHPRRGNVDSTLLYAKQLPVLTDSTTLFLLLQTGISEKEVDRLTLANYPQTANHIVHYFENHGCPFVKVTLGTHISDGDTTAFDLNIEPGPFITFDSIVVKGDVKLSKHFLYPYLGLRRGQPYREDIIQAVNTKLEELPFATQIREAGISFVEDKAYLYVYLDPRRTNRFDGYIGLVPVDEKTGKVSVHGALDLDLQNLLKQGEQIRLSWASSERHSQNLDITFRLPYIAKSRFGVAARFQMDKQDTSYLNLNYHIGIPYAFTSNSYLQPYFDFTTSSVMDANLLNLELDTGYLDYRKSLYGLRLRYCHVDYIFNPRRGIDLNANLSAGRRVILPNNQVDASLYDDIEMKKTSYRLTGDVSGYIPMGKRFVLILRAMGGSLLGGVHYGNELLKIGGEEFVRGFNINDLTASTYLLGKAEVRYIFGRQSYLHIFFDGGVYEQNLSNGYYKDVPLGLGLGLTFSTKAGMFYFDYALGSRRGSPFSFKTGKVHFGIKTQF